MRRRISFQDDAFKDYRDWATDDPAIFKKINQLLEDIQRSPFLGLGKPEPLRHSRKGFWSRQITLEHRLVYKIVDEEIRVTACKYHYKD